jgi:biotin-(acetyl-CoA carboxylase) ligase
LGQRQARGRQQKKWQISGGIRVYSTLAGAKMAAITLQTITPTRLAGLP